MGTTHLSAPGSPGAPWRVVPSSAHLWCPSSGIYVVLTLKNKQRTFGTKCHRLEAEFGQEHFCPPVERFYRGNFPPEGGNRSHRHHQQPSHLWEANLHQHQQIISNPSSSLVFNLGTGTIDSCLWVTSSVDYIL